jgi:hypothetical protein
MDAANNYIVRPEFNILENTHGGGPYPIELYCRCDAGNEGNAGRRKLVHVSNEKLAAQRHSLIFTGRTKIIVVTGEIFHLLTRGVV